LTARPTGDLPGPPRGLPNFRDIGGVRAAGGQRVRRGLVFRSAALARASGAGLAVLSRLGVRTVLDLRSDWERGRAPESQLLGPAIDYVVVDVAGDSLVRSPMWLLATLDTAEARRAAFAGGRAEAMFEAKFRDFVSGPGPRAAFGVLFARLAAEAALPAVIHCSTGKDRTGWAAGALLAYLGVAEADVEADFTAGNAAVRELMAPVVRRHVEEGGQAVDLDALIGVRPSYLRAAFDEVARGWGTIDRYVEEGLGLGADAGAELRARLLAPV
jgi:protein-tyrosine phosphatase